MRTTIWLIIAFCLYILYGIVLSQWDISVVNQDIQKTHPDGYYDYRGITNAHTSFNQGSGHHLDIIQEAKDTGLDFIFFTDLNQFEVPSNLEGYNGNLLVLFAGQYSYVDSRLIYFHFMKKLDVSSLGEIQVRFTDYLSQKNHDTKDGFLVLSHPTLNGFRWTGSYEGIDGIEILNLKSLSVKSWQSSALSFLWSFFVYPFNQKIAFLRLFQEPVEELELWDKLNNEKPTIGMAGSQATAKAVLWNDYSLQFPSYKRLFELISNHVILKSELTGNAINDRQKILGALQQGQFYMSIDLLGDPSGFRCFIDDGEKTRMMGDEIKFSKKLRADVSLPSTPKVPFEIVLLRNGQRIATSNEPKLDVAISEPGVYRVIVRVIPTFPIPDGKKWLTWIYSNPFYVRP